MERTLSLMVSVYQAGNRRDGSGTSNASPDVRDVRVLDGLGMSRSALALGENQLRVSWLSLSAFVDGMELNVMYARIGLPRRFSTEGGSASRPVRIFVVEDVRLVRRRIVSALMAEPGLLVVGEADSVKAAQDILTSLAVDVLISDISLPGTSELRNGLDLIKWAVNHDPELRAIVLTNYADEAYRQASKRVGAVAFLDKSSEFEKLTPTIRRAVS